MVFGIEGVVPNFLIVFVSLVVLVYGAEKLIDSLAALAKRVGVSDIFIAVTLISLGTSLPEISAHVIASLKILAQPHNFELYRITSSAVLGGNIGSDVVQQTLIVGIVVLGMGGLKFRKSFLKHQYSVMVGTTLLTLILCIDGTISRFDGLILLISFFAYMYFLWRGKSDVIYSRKGRRESKNIFKDIMFILVGLSCIVVGAYIALSGTEKLVEMTGLGGSIIGVVTLGIAAALPEMFTAISGLRHGAAGISLGTLIGSNITNPLLGIGLGSLMSTYWTPAPLYLWDLPMETITAALLLVYLLFHHKKLGRIGGIYLIGLYIFYIVVRFMFFAVD